MRFRATLSRIRALFSRRGIEEDFAQELDTHLSLLTDDFVRRGLAPDEARRAARLRLGGEAGLQQTNRELWGFPTLESLAQDVRYALRTLRRSPGFTAVAALTLALGIGANTAIFSIVYAEILRPLPFPRPQQLVGVFDARLQDNIQPTGLSYPDYLELRRENHVFSEIAGVNAHELTLTGNGDPTVVKTTVVTPEFFALLGVTPLYGRTFVAEDGQQGAAPAAILDEHLWRQRFAADPTVIGRAITLDQRAFTVVGVLPADFRFPLIDADRGQRAKQDVWIPIVQDPLFGPWTARRGPPGHWLPIVARLKPGVSAAQADAELKTIAARLAREFPAHDRGWTMGTMPLQREIVGDLESPLLVLWAAVGVVLLIACVNIADLMLARATARAREMTIRAALGASRARILRQLLTESAILGLLGGAAGVGLAYGAVSAFAARLPLPPLRPIRVDTGVLLIALIASVGAGTLAGLAPAIFAAERGARGGPGDSFVAIGGRLKRRSGRDWLAGAEVALATVLLVAAGLLIRSFGTLVSIDPGFRAEHVVRADVSLPQFQYARPRQWASFADELLDRLRAEPGMADSAIGVPLPFSGNVELPFDIVDRPPSKAGTTRTADFVSTTPGYFQAMGISLVRGRAFTRDDADSAPRVTVVSEAFARVYFPDEDPIGKRLVFAFPPAKGVPREIVGIVSDVRDVSLGETPGPMMYVPFAQAPFWGGEIVVRSPLPEAVVAATIRRDVAAIDRDLPVTDVASLPEVLAGAVAQPRFRTWLLSLFAGLALALAAAGIFGVLSYTVSRRTREIGIRIALGASASNVLRVMVGESARIILAGLAVGIPASFALTRFLSGLLFSVRPADPITFAAASALLAIVGLAASYVPTRRAMRVDPVVALRNE